MTRKACSRRNVVKSIKSDKESYILTGIKTSGPQYIQLRFQISWSENRIQERRMEQISVSVNVIL